MTNNDYKEYKEFMSRVCTVAHEETNDLKKQLDITKDQAIGLYLITMIDKLTSTLAATLSNGNGVSDTPASSSDSASGKQAKKS